MELELLLNIFIIFCIFVIGTLFGSFFSLATYRIPRKEDIIATRSYCPNCKHRLEFFDLIPILSYIFHLGKCKYCKQKISPRYILLEVSNGIAFVLMYFLIGYNIKFLALIIVYVALFIIIGSNIMQNKMTSEEIKEVEEKVKNKNNKQNGKKGVFLIELIAALLLFTILMVASFTIMRNYSSKSYDTLVRSNAIELGIKAIEVSKATDYSDLISYTEDFVVDSITYTVDVTVKKLADDDFEKKDLVATVYVTVSYMNNDVPYEVNFKTLQVNNKMI